MYPGRADTGRSSLTFGPSCGPQHRRVHSPARCRPIRYPPSINAAPGNLDRPATTGPGRARRMVSLAASSSLSGTHLRTVPDKSEVSSLGSRPPAKPGRAPANAETLVPTPRRHTSAPTATAVVHFLHTTLRRLRTPRRHCSRHRQNAQLAAPAALRCAPVCAQPHGRASRTWGVAWQKPRAYDGRTSCAAGPCCRWVEPAFRSFFRRKSR